MRLFAPLSEAEADQAEHGSLRGDHVWVDNPRPKEAATDAVWVSIEIPDNRMAKFEKQPEPRLGYREFLLPSRITNLGGSTCRFDRPMNCDSDLFASAGLEEQ